MTTIRVQQFADWYKMQGNHNNESNRKHDKQTYRSNNMPLFTPKPKQKEFVQQQMPSS
jgi:hypothetical protein